MAKLTDELKRDLIVSVGTHKGRRPLSPMEVAEGFNIAKKIGMSTKQIAEMVQIDSSMVGRFMRLLELSPIVKHLVDWGQSSSTISFSAATELTGLTISEQEAVATAVLKYCLTKSEVIQIVQVKKRSNEIMATCVQNIIKLRPEIIRKFVFIGAIQDKKLISKLLEMKQSERNRLLHQILTELVSNVEFEGRLGANLFSLTGGDQFAQQLRKLEPDFECVINKHLETKFNEEQE